MAATSASKLSDEALAPMISLLQEIEQSKMTADMGATTNMVGVQSFF